MPEQQPSPAQKALHDIGNHLAIAVGFADLLLESIPPDDARHADVLEVRNAAHAAMKLIPELAKGLD